MGHGSSHFRFFSPVNVFFLPKSKIGHLRPEIPLFQSYLVEPEVPEAHHTSLQSPILGQLLAQKMVGIIHLLHTSGIARCGTFGPVLK